MPRETTSRGLCITHVPGTVTNQFRDPIFFHLENASSGEGNCAHGCPTHGGKQLLCALFNLHAQSSQTKWSHDGAVAWNARQCPDRFHAPAARLHCIFWPRDLGMLAFVFGLFRWSANLCVYLSFIPNRKNFPFSVPGREPAPCDHVHPTTVSIQYLFSCFFLPHTPLDAIQNGIRNSTPFVFFCNVS